jgi:site-specific DNA recombinase
VTKPVKVVRCAIYTRKSSEEGLDQAFNSLHAQRDACEAYIKSQVAEGWRPLPKAYDDGGFSGGNLTRPAMESLLADVDAGRIDVIVVYKVDRLTRSLADFARIVDRLDAAGASFVSVTQAFNTTNSMGRLTLNVLLSFAQFEREVTGERIRDKIAASKAKGMWMGGILPLGYDGPTDQTTRALVVNKREAVTVRRIFQSYLALGSVHALEAELDAEGVRSKAWLSRAGKPVGGVRLSRGALFHLLKNRVYLGEIRHGERSYPGAHPAIIDVQAFEAVQVLLASHRREWRERPLRSASMPLKGLLFDVDGSPMSPSFTHNKAGRLYRYYVSAPLQQGRQIKLNPDAIRRVPASEIEEVLVQDLRRRLCADEDAPLDSFIGALVRVDLEARAVRLTLTKAKLPRSAAPDCEPHPSDANLAIAIVPIRCRLRGGRASAIAPAGTNAVRVSRRDPKLIKALQKAHQIAGALGWRSDDGDLKGSGTAGPASYYDRKLCRLAFLAPDIQKRIFEGRQPAGMNIERLLARPVPTCWIAQRRLFAIPEN